jgi:arylsulfatase A-like enzyme
MPEPRPSFILFITDQHRADYLGCMGHPVLATPNIDALAARGTIWDRFYVSSPVCMPNRASLMTCRLPSSHGVRANGIPLDKRNVTFVELLRDAGYSTALIGKSHLQNFSGHPPTLPRPATRPGFHRANGPLCEAVRHDLASYSQEAPGRDYNVDTPFYGFDHVELVTGHGDDCGGDYRRWLREREPDADRLIGRENQLPHDYTCPQAVRTALPEELYSTTYIAERAEAWLHAHANGTRPFFLMVSFPDPHHPFNPPGRYWDMYSPDDMKTPEAFLVNDWSPPPHVAGVIGEREAGDAILGGMGTVGVYEREAREAQALTCGMIAMIDDAIGRLRAVPGAEKAIQVFTTDHGDHLGDHRLLFKGAEQYEQITRVPFIWADPEGPAGQRTDAMGQTHDIGATILERARVEPAIGMHGRSLLEGGRDAALIQYDHQKDNPGLGIGPRVHTLRAGEWRLSLFEGVDWGELYNLECDPGEFRNLWVDGAYADIKAALMERLARAEIASVDRAPFPTGRA